MRVFRRNRGLISVFLVIILVPIITVTSLFVDASRMMLAKSVVSSAGDLALNSMMTQYDAGLNDFYGLMASAQNVNEFKSKVKTYFKNSMESKGVANTDAQMIAQKAGEIMDASASYSDLLQIQLDDSAFDVGTISNSGLNNPAVIKTQIVNFMKYRAPIDGVDELLKKFKKISDATKYASEEAELIKKKEEAANKQKEVMTALEQMWNDCVEYQEKVQVIKSGANERECLNEVYNYCVDSENKYREIHISVIKELLYASEMNNGIKEFNADKVTKYTGNNYTVRRRAKESDIIDAIRELSEALYEYNKKEQEKKVRNILDEFDNSTKSDAVKYITYGKQISDEYAKYLAQINLINQKYRKLQLAVKFPQDGIDVDEDGKNIIATYSDFNTRDYKGSYKRIKEQLGREVTHVNAEITKTSTPYGKIQSDRNKYTVSQSKITQMIQKRKEELNKKVREIHATLKNQYDQLLEISKYINNTMIPHLNKIVEALEAFETAEKNREDAARALADKSEVAKSDVECFTDTSEGSEGAELAELREKVSRSDIASFRTRLNNIKTQIDRDHLPMYIKAIRYGNTPIKDITSVDKLMDHLKNNQLVTQEDVKTKSAAELEQLAISIFRSANPPVYTRFQATGEAHRKWIKEYSSSPELGYEKGSHYTSLYYYMEKKFKEKKDGEKQYEKKKNKKDDLVDQEKDEKKTVNISADFKSTDKEIASMANLPSKSWKGGISGSIAASKDDKNSKKNVDMEASSQKINSVFGDTMNKIKSAAASVRDDLYAMDYIFNMFTCDTTVKEALYDIAEGKRKDLSTINKVVQAQNQVVDDFNSTDIKNEYNRTMTNKLICNKNNVSMGNEIEYILYGGNNKENKQKSWGTIFVLRFALNAIYGFSNLYSPTKSTDAALIQTTAASISAASAGIIPIPLVKIAIILAVVMAESLQDLAFMKAGMPVALLKNEDTWKTSLSSVFDDMKGGSSNSSTGSGSSNLIRFQYSDYLRLFLLLSMIGQHEDAIYLRTADVIQANMQSREEGFQMSKAKTWFHIKAKVKVTPLLLNLSINQGTLNSAGISSDRVQNSWTSYTYEMSNGYY